MNPVDIPSMALHPGFLPMARGAPPGPPLHGYQSKVDPGPLTGVLPLAGKERVMSFPPGSPYLNYETLAALHHPYGYAAFDPRRKSTTRESTNTLKAWLHEHQKNPYPTKGEKIMLAIITKMTLTQVSTWFANARRRLKKEKKLSWNADSEDGSGEVGHRACSDSEDAGDASAGDLDADVDVEGDFDDLDPKMSPESVEQRLRPPALTSQQNGRPSNQPKQESTAANLPNDSHSPSKPKIWSLADLATGKDCTTSDSQSESTTGLCTNSASGHCDSNLSNKESGLALNPLHPPLNPYFPYGLPFSHKHKTRISQDGLGNTAEKLCASFSRDTYYASNH